MKDKYKELEKFKRKFPITVAWRIKKHFSVIATHIDPDEVIDYIFCGQKGTGTFFNSAVIAITNKRILIGRKRLFFGYFLDIITPDMFNDMNILARLLWGTVSIDTIKELVIFAKIDKRALNEIEDFVSKAMDVK